MSKGRSQRPLPSTPGPQPPPEPADVGAAEAAAGGPGPAPASGPTRPASARSQARSAGRAAHDVEPFLIAGTKCVAGHERGHELEAGPIGTLPSRRTAWIGFGLLVWCGIGLALILDPQWVTMGVLVAVLWLVFSAFIQRRLGHRRRCWRTRAWRQAWGGLVPSRD